MALIDLVHDTFGSAFRISRWFIPGHDGIDLAAKEGTPIRAVAAGTVSYARDARTQADKGSKGWAMGGGNVVNINVGGDLRTQYAHLSRIVVSEGQHVSKGQIIGYVGKTGGQTSSGAYGGPGAEFVGAHLHFGLWNTRTNKMVNPKAFLEKAGKVTPTQGDDWQKPSLGGFNNLVSFPVGHVITANDITSISKKLSDAGWFENSIQQIAFEEFMKQNALGKAWDKSLQDKLAGQAIADAQNIGNAVDVGGAIGNLGGTLVQVATFGAAIVLVIVGLFMYQRSSDGGVRVAA